MIYLILGNNIALKQQKINEIKAKYLTQDDAIHFDFEQLYGDKLPADDLKKALLNLPAVSKKRVVIVKNIEKLKADHQRIIEAYVVEKERPAALILDSDQSDLKSAFVSDLKRVAQVTVAEEGVKLNAFDLTNALERRQPVNALKNLSQLIEEGSHPLQLMGMLIWFWGKMKGKMSRGQFQKGLELLQEADLNIKRSRLEPEHAVEKLVVSLAALLA